MQEYKIVLLGGGGAGKSALTVQFIQGIFVEMYDPTIEDSYRKQVTIGGKECMLEILDTAGTEQFKCMRDMYIQNAHGLVLVYSIASQTSFQELMEIREQILSIKGTLDVPLILVGNKCDLEVERCIWTSQGLDLSKHFNDCVYVEASAKQRINVDEIFYELVKAINVKMPEKKPKKKKKKKPRCNLM